MASPLDIQFSSSKAPRLDNVASTAVAQSVSLHDHRNQVQSLPRSTRSGSVSHPPNSQGQPPIQRYLPASTTEATNHHAVASGSSSAVESEDVEIQIRKPSNEFAIEDDLQFGDLEDDLESNSNVRLNTARPRTGSHLDTVLSAPLRPSPRVTYEMRGRPPSIDLDTAHRSSSQSSGRQGLMLPRSRRLSGNNREKEEDRSSMDAPSHPDSQHGEDEEAEQDVCFPMSEEFTYAEGIDFDELDAFVIEQTTAMLRHNTRDTRRMSTNSKSNAQISIDEKLLDSSGSNTDTDRPLSSDQTSSSRTQRDYSSRFASPSIAPLKTHHMQVPDLSTTSLFNNANFISKAPSVSRTLTANHLRQMERGQNAPDRFSFFTSERDETVHAPDLGGLLDESAGSFKKLFRQDRGCWWLDVMCPTDAEMKLLAKAFGIHPLTAEDIRVQEAREKVELFKSYYFVCFKSFDHDKESEDFLEPVNIYVVVFKEGLLSFHFAPTSHPANVRRRIRQLRDYVSVSADWISYAIIDDVTDVFMPLIHEIELETDSIEDAVMITRETDTGDMLRRIGECRKKVMALFRLLHGKADVIKMFAKRCNEQWDVAPKGEIGLYLGDIQDHLITMTSSLTQFEKILSRSHSNYLAQLSIHSMESNNRLNSVLGKITFIATMLVPMNLLTGLFGKHLSFLSPR